MPFSSPMVLHLASGEKLQVKSSDISSAGSGSRCPTCLSIRPASRSRFSSPAWKGRTPHPVLRQPIVYQILGEEQKEGKYWLRLVKSGEHPAFDSSCATSSNTTATATGSASTTCCRPPSSRG